MVAAHTRPLAKDGEPSAAEVDRIEGNDEPSRRLGVVAGFVDRVREGGVEQFDREGCGVPLECVAVDVDLARGSGDLGASGPDVVEDGRGHTGSEGSGILHAGVPPGMRCRFLATTE